MSEALSFETETTKNLLPMDTITEKTSKQEIISAAVEAIDGYQAQVSELQQRLRVSVYAAVTFFLLGVIF